MSQTQRIRETVVTCTDVSKRYADGAKQVSAVRDVSLETREAEMVAVVGPSGSGKTTLLHLLGGIERPDDGSVVAAGAELSDLNGSELAAFRAHNVSFVFAHLNLLPVLSLYENITLALGVLPLSPAEAHGRAMQALDAVGLADLAHRMPDALSSGERQRGAIARALARDSAIVIADEPTAHLDHDRAVAITTLLRHVADHAGASVIIATHDQTVADFADRVIRLEDGRRVD